MKCLALKDNIKQAWTCVSIKESGHKMNMKITKEVKSVNVLVLWQREKASEI